MNLFASVRSVVTGNHALIVPESFVRSSLPGWERTEGVILISPRMGARFTQYLAIMDAGATAEPPSAGRERVIFVLEGEVECRPGRSPDRVLTTGGFAYLPPAADLVLQARKPSRLNVFEKVYVALAGVAPPAWRAGQEQEFTGQPFLGDPDARLKTLLPDERSFDLAVNVFTFRPGTALPFVEVHVMEHGLLMLDGSGIYRLGESWYPVRQGDVIWMAPYCPQWFVAMGKEPARYLYYKDINRDPLLSCP
jgi:(S)-ureidoglycine aminohydrolase